MSTCGSQNFNLVAEQQFSPMPSDSAASSAAPSGTVTLPHLLAEVAHNLGATQDNQMIYLQLFADITASYGSP